MPAMQPHHEHPRTSIPTGFRGALAAGAILLVTAAAGLLLIQDPSQRAVFSDLASPAIDLFALFFLFLAARANGVRPAKWNIGWTVIALAVLLYSLGDSAWALLEMVWQADAFPSIADAFYLIYYPVFLAGVILVLRRSSTREELVNDAVDLAIILSAAALGMANFVIGPILQSSVDSPALEQAILVAYPAGDLILLGALLLILYGDPNRTGPDGDGQAPIPMFLLAGGIFLMIVADLVYTYQGLADTYASGGWVDLGWLAGNLVIGLAGAAQWTAAQPGSIIGGYRPGPRFLARAKLVKTYLSDAALVGAFSLLIIQVLSPLPMGLIPTASIVGLALGLVLLRHVLTLSANQKLNIRLKEQAVRLESANRELEMEIAERTLAEERLAFDVLHDQLTGLPNRRLFSDRLGQLLSRSKRHKGMTFGVLFMDLDQFKAVNDSLGHSVGDQLLVAVGKRIRDTLRSGDTVARFGGDEFAVLLDDLGREDLAVLLAQSILDALQQPFNLGYSDIHISASIGIVTDLIKYESPDHLLRDADLAMYRAKALGKARFVVFKPEMRDQAYVRLSMEEWLRTGMQHGDFRLHYQPILSLGSGRLVGFEALLRWQHPLRGLLLPGEFLSVAEECDLILPIGEWVLNQSCRQLKAWQDRFPELAEAVVSVNLSDKEFAQVDLVNKVAGALAASGLRGSCLGLEITERVLVDNYPTAREAISALHQMGVKVQIDDFGTGYSALSYLQRFPLSAIKLDKSFIYEICDNPKGLGVVRAIVSMARELGMETIAEGIETKEQLSELKSLLCEFGQGYLLSEPLDIDRAEALLNRIAA